MMQGAEGTQNNCHQDLGREGRTKWNREAKWARESLAETRNGKATHRESFWYDVLDVRVRRMKGKVGGWIGAPMVEESK